VTQHRVRPDDVVGCAAAPQVGLRLDELRQRLGAGVRAQAFLLGLCAVLAKLQGRVLCDIVSAWTGFTRYGLMKVHLQTFMLGHSKAVWLRCVGKCDPSAIRSMPG
jgi:hypothetical protein